MAVAVETETTKEMAVWTAQLVVAVLTQCELKQHCWLERVSAHTTAKENEMTYQCCLGHPSDPQIVRTETLGVNIKIEHMNYKTAQEIKMTRLKCIWTAQPPENASKRCYGDIWH